jgi:hypothetical protein
MLVHTTLTIAAIRQVKLPDIVVTKPLKLLNISLVKTQINALVRLVIQTIPLK